MKSKLHLLAMAVAVLGMVSVNAFAGGWGGPGCDSKSHYDKKTVMQDSKSGN